MLKGPSITRSCITRSNKKQLFQIKQKHYSSKESHKHLEAVLKVPKITNSDHQMILLALPQNPSSWNGRHMLGLLNCCTTYNFVTTLLIKIDSQQKGLKCRFVGP